ncbi:MAG: hypothetical protein WCQ23_06910 [Candidatus Methanomethylophilaceae archaeon]|jgi:hypothetical protein
MLGHRLVERTGPELAVQEVLYGFVMALTFIIAARAGIFTYDTPWNLVMMILAMNFVWGAIDMIIFYRIDVSTQRRYTRILKEDRRADGYREKIDGELDNTIFDVLTEDDRQKGVDVVIDGTIESERDIWSDRKRMFQSSAACFIITVATAIPVIAALLLIDDQTAALDAAAVLASVSLFFVGCNIDREASKGIRLAEGLSIMALALMLSLFAAYFGG